MSNGDNNAGILRTFCSITGVFRPHGEWLLHKNVLVVCRRCDDLVEVLTVRRCEHNSVDIVTLHQTLVIGYRR